MHSHSRTSEASKASKASKAAYCCKLLATVAAYCCKPVKPVKQQQQSGPRTCSCARNSCTDILRCTSLKSAHTHALSPALSPASAPRALRPAAARLERSKNPSAALALRGAEEEGGVAVWMRRAARMRQHTSAYVRTHTYADGSIPYVSIRQHTCSVDAARCTAASLCAAQYLYSSTSKARQLAPGARMHARCTAASLCATIRRRR